MSWINMPGESAAAETRALPVGVLEPLRFWRSVLGILAQRSTNNAGHHAATFLGLILVVPAVAQAQTPGLQQTLQGLLSGNQGQDQAVREAYERGYQRGRQDGARAAGQNRRESDRYGQDPRAYPNERRPDPPYYNR
jgi:hypothetical protein